MAANTESAPLSWSSMSDPLLMNIRKASPECYHDYIRRSAAVMLGVTFVDVPSAAGEFVLSAVVVSFVDESRAKWKCSRVGGEMHGSLGGVT